MKNPYNKYEELTMEQLEQVVKEYYEKHPPKYTVTDIGKGYVMLKGPGIIMCLPKDQYIKMMKEHFEEEKISLQ